MKKQMFKRVSAAILAMVMMIVMMPAVALVPLLMMVPAAALVSMVMMVMSAPTAMTVIMVMMVVLLMAVLSFFLHGVNFYISLHRPGNSDQFRDQCIGVLRRQPQLLGGKGDDCLLHLFMGVKLGFDLGCAVGAVQIFYGISLLGHGNVLLTYFNT